MEKCEIPKCLIEKENWVIDVNNVTVTSVLIPRSTKMLYQGLFLLNPSSTHMSKTYVNNLISSRSGLHSFLKSKKKILKDLSD